MHLRHMILLPYGCFYKFEILARILSREIGFLSRGFEILVGSTHGRFRVDMVKWLFL